MQCILIPMPPPRPRRHRTTQPTEQEQRINAALAELAKERGVSQMELERRIAATSQPIDQSSISQAFNGLRSLTLSEFDAIISALGVTWSDVTKRAGVR